MKTLQCNIGSNLLLEDPFMVASSHWTSDENSLKKFIKVKPSALTLKTISPNFGGDGKTIVARSREWSEIITSFGDNYGRYVDGPKKIELLDLSTAYKILQYSNNELDSKIGISVLQNENYNEIFNALNEQKYSYVELNWKYSFRKIKLADIDIYIDIILNDIRNFSEVFSETTKIVKVPREVIEPFMLEKILPILEYLEEKKIPIIIANSKKFEIPPSKSSMKNGILRELGDGVIIGEFLFIETFNTIKKLTKLRHNGYKIPQIISSGGITDIRSVVDVIAAGASAIQLCTALDLRGVNSIKLLREQLVEISEEFNNFEDFVTEIHSNDAAWMLAAERAKESVQKISKNINSIFRLDEEISRRLVKAIQIELKEPDKHLNILTKEINNEYEIIPDDYDMNDEYSVLVNLNSISSFLLSENLVSQYDFIPIDYAFSKNILHYFKNRDQDYDFAIIPRSLLNLLQSEPQALNAKLPIEIGNVGKTIIEVVGDIRTEMKNICKVFTFGGLSSGYAQNRLIRNFHPEIIEIKNKELIAILKYWDSDSGIIADYPLSRLYSSFCSEQTKKNWGKLWSVEQDLIFVASYRLYSQRNKRKEILYIYEKIIKNLASELLSKSETSARQLVSRGFSSYLCDLFGVNQKTKFSF